MVYCSVKSDRKKDLPYPRITCSYTARRERNGLPFSTSFVFAKFLQQGCLYTMTGKLEAASHCYRPNLSVEL